MTLGGTSDGPRRRASAAHAGDRGCGREPAARPGRVGERRAEVEVPGVSSCSKILSVEQSNRPDQEPGAEAIFSNKKFAALPLSENTQKALIEMEQGVAGMVNVMRAPKGK